MSLPSIHRMWVESVFRRYDKASPLTRQVMFIASPAFDDVERLKALPDAERAARLKEIAIRQGKALPEDFNPPKRGRRNV